MYAIIRAGGKQAKVREGDVLDVERMKSAGPTVTFIPLLVVQDDGTVVSDRALLENSAVTAEVVGEHRGDKIEVFKYKAKTGYRRSQGHRQTYTTLRVTSIGDGAADKTAKKSRATKAAAEGEAVATEPAETAAAEEATAKPAAATRTRSTAEAKTEAGSGGKTTRRSTKSSAEAKTEAGSAGKTTERSTKSSAEAKTEVGSAGKTTRRSSVRSKRKSEAGGSESGEES